RNMPPEPSVRPWMLLFYSDQKENMTPQEFWTDYSKDLFKRMKPRMKVKGDVKKLAAQLTSQAATPREKLQRIFEYCRAEIQSIYDDAVQLSEKDRKKGQQNNSPSDTIKRGFGTYQDIDFLFAALANASGFDARYALMGDRSDFFFTPQITDAYFLTNWAIAVNEGEQWSFHSPASRHLPFGMLRWQEEAQQALILDPDQPLFAETPLAEAESSLQKRTAQLQLDREGTLQGRCRIEYTGHQAAVQEMVQKWFNNAEVSEVQIENLEDPSKPLIYSWQVRVPSYAQGTAKRLFLQPAFFQTGTEPRFTSSQRRHRIYFNYRWSEEDDVTIDLPQGMILEGAGSPPPFSPQKVAHYSAQVAVGKDGRQLIYQRRFAFRGLLFTPSSYSGLKQIFDDVHQRDTHTIILKRQAEGGH
ncbi:MAG: transglutaminase-like domain-containing protein, partial [Acidobacteriota bacterium]